MRVKKLSRKQKGRLIVLITLSFFAVFFAFLSRSVAQTLITQQVAERWGERGFGQVSAFVPEHRGFSGDFGRDFQNAMDGSFVEQGLNLGDAEHAWTFAYHAEGGVLEARSLYRGPISVHASGIGGNFFFFYPVTLINGSYLPRESINRDLVFIDEMVAWELFGARDVTGMELIFEGRHYVIAGVFRHFDDRFSQRARPDLPQVFFYYDELEHLVGGLRVTTIHAVLPNSIRGFAGQLLSSTLETAGLEEGDYLLVNHNERYRFLPLLRIVRDFGARSMQDTGMRLPPWENAARMTEDFAALYLLFALLFATLPVFSLCYFAVWRFRKRKWRMRHLITLADNKREAKREVMWQQAEQRRMYTEQTEQFTVEQIIKESREEEEKNEKDA